MANREVAPNVLAFLDKAANDYAAIKREQFSEGMYCLAVEGDTESPIEDLFYIAIEVLAAAHFIDINPDPWVRNDGQLEPGCGLHVTSQQKIGKYRVDFVVLEHRYKQETPKIVVELDGHAFHDKNKQQRAYEKQRDRNLVKNGYQVLHYTGSEVVKDPYAVAFEVLQLCGAISKVEEYDPENPWGIE